MANYGAIGPSPAVEGSGRKASVKLVAALAGIAALGMIAAVVAFNAASSGNVELLEEPPVHFRPMGAKVQLPRTTMLMYGNVEYPEENFNWYKESGEPQCEGGVCAFRDKVFTVEGWDQMCIQNCGEIDSIIEKANAAQKQNVQLASTRPQMLAEEEKEEEGEPLAAKGVVVDSWPIEEEGPMSPAQHQDKPALMQNWGEFWDNGDELPKAGVNMDGMPLTLDDGKPGSEANLNANGVMLDSWPWGEESVQGDGQGGNLKGVNVHSWWAQPHI